MFSEENNVPRTLFEARKMAGSAKYKQSSPSNKQSIKVTLFI